MAPDKAKSPQPGRSPQMHLPPDLEAVYANIVRIAHTPAEMMIDFACLLPGDPSAPIKARVLMSPLSAKLFMKALADNLAKYEAVYGEIAIPKKHSLADFLFKPPSPPDSPAEEGD